MEGAELLWKRGGTKFENDKTRDKSSINNTVIYGNGANDKKIVPVVIVIFDQPRGRLGRTFMRLLKFLSTILSIWYSAENIYTSNLKIDSGQEIILCWNINIFTIYFLPCSKEILAE